MSRRRTHYDPVTDRAVSRLSINSLGTTLNDVLSTLPDNEVEVLRRALSGIPLVRIAEADRTSVQAVRAALSKSLSRLRHPSRSTLLHDFLDDDLGRLLSNAATSPLTRESRSKWHWCARHKKWVVYSKDLAQCAMCPCGLLIRREEDCALTSTGRPRLYCSNACRQAAFRARKQGKEYSEVTWPTLVPTEATADDRSAHLQH